MDLGYELTASDLRAEVAMRRPAYELTGCTFDGAGFCPTHCPDPEHCETEHGACFLSDEWQCALGACDVCGDLIDGTVIHDERSTPIHECRYCGIETGSNY